MGVFAFSRPVVQDHRFVKPTERNALMSLFVRGLLFVLLLHFSWDNQSWLLHVTLKSFSKLSVLNRIQLTCTVMSVKCVFDTRADANDCFIMIILCKWQWLCLLMRCTTGCRLKSDPFQGWGEHSAGRFHEPTSATLFSLLLHLWALFFCLSHCGPT